MKSKSFDVKQSLADKSKANRSYDFVNLYKPDSENYDYISKDSIQAGKAGGSMATKRERSPNKKKKSKQEPLEVSHITVDGPSPARGAGPSPTGTPRVTSTPKPVVKPTPKVKSIMKSSPAAAAAAAAAADAPEGEASFTFTPKSKKRNKSVSFMLDDTEEIAVKKTKSDESEHVDKKNNKKTKLDKEPKKLKKGKKYLQAEKENKDVINMEVDHSKKQKTELDKKTKTKVFKRKNSIGDVPADPENSQASQDKKKKLKKRKKVKQDEENVEPIENANNNQEDNQSESKPKKSKKKKNVKDAATDALENEGEPATKSRKKEAKPDKIAEDLENLSIGDNPHTLSSLLDEMTVVDKEEKKKNKHRRKKIVNTSNVSSEATDLEKIEEGKEKVKWKKRKWNKDKKGGVEDITTSVVIDNLPLKVILTYKKLLAEHFEKAGLVKKIGIAEVYPAEQQVPVFTTTVTFYSDGAATKALEENNTILEGSRIRVKRPLPPTATTLVVRSYAELTDQNISSTFSEAGRIRNIRQLVKGKKAMATAFVVFDSAEAAERGLKLAEDAKIGGKKIHVTKFELRSGKQKQKKPSAESENEGDSENSD